jgi:proline iminopeptidase
VLSLEDGWEPSPRYVDPAFRMTFARIVTRYFHHGAWLRDGQLLDEAYRLADIPGVIIHGRLDLDGPADAAGSSRAPGPPASCSSSATVTAAARR